ncbi:LysR family transcriptional regulator [Actinomycetota bacterium]
MLNPVQLRTLAAVIATGSFADAARTLGYTGSAVSQQISALERAVRFPLFEREAHSVRPTPAAIHLSAKATTALAALNDLEQEARHLAEGAVGDIRIGSVATANARVLPPALARFLTDNPRVSVHLDEGEPDTLGPAVLDGRLDLAVVYQYDLVPRTTDPSLRRTPLLDESLLLLLPEGHRLADTGAVAVADLADETWVATSARSMAAACLRRLCGKAGFEPRVDLRTNDYGVIHELVRMGLGIALVPALGHRPTAGVVTARLGRGDEGVGRHLLALHRQAQSTAVTDSAIAALRSACAEIAAATPDSLITLP